MIKDVDFDRLCGIAIARLQITYNEFYELTPVEFQYALQVKAEMELETIKSRMEAARFVAVHVWNSAGKSMKRKQFDPQKLLPFSWDKDKEPVIQSAEQMKATMFGIMTSQNKAIERKEKKKRHG